MSDIEELLKKYTDTTTTKLGEFEGKVDSISQLVTAMTKKADEAEAKSNRLLLAGGGHVDQAAEVKSLTIPEEERKTLRAILENKAASMQVASGPDGGFLCPDETSRQIEALIRKQSPIRRLARSTTFAASSAKYPISTGGTESGWIGENDDRVETDTPKIGSVMPSGGTLYALPVATEEVVEDCILNLEGFIQDNVIDSMSEKESIAFIFGDGINKPDGFLSRPTAATIDGGRPLGTVQYVPSGSAASLGSTDNLIGKLVAMVYAVKAGYRQAPGCAWLASTDMIAVIATLKDANGNPIFLPSLREGVPGYLLGYPVEECEHMPGTAANTFPIAFGNWQRGYLVADRTSLTILRDPYTTKGKIKWYFRKRVHGTVLNSEAIKLLKVAAA